MVAIVWAVGMFTLALLLLVPRGSIASEIMEAAYIIGFALLASAGTIAVAMVQARPKQLYLGEKTLQTPADIKTPTPDNYPHEYDTSAPARAKGGVPEQSLPRERIRRFP